MKRFADFIHSGRFQKKTGDAETDFLYTLAAATSYTVTVNHMFNGAPIAEPTVITVEGVYEGEVAEVTVTPVTLPGYFLPLFFFTMFLVTIALLYVYMFQFIVYLFVYGSIEKSEEERKKMGSPRKEEFPTSGTFQDKDPHLPLQQLT